MRRDARARLTNRNVVSATIVEPLPERKRSVTCLTGGAHATPLVCGGLLGCPVGTGPRQGSAAATTPDHRSHPREFWGMPIVLKKDPGHYGGLCDTLRCQEHLRARQESRSSSRVPAVSVAGHGASARRSLGAVSDRRRWRRRPLPSVTVARGPGWQRSLPASGAIKQHPRRAVAGAAPCCRHPRPYGSVCSFRRRWRA